MPSKLPHYALRIPTALMDKLKFIAYEAGRSANKEIEQLIIKHVRAYEEYNGEITDDDIKRAHDTLY